MTSMTCAHFEHTPLSVMHMVLMAIVVLVYIVCMHECKNANSAAAVTVTGSTSNFHSKWLGTVHPKCLRQILSYTKGYVQDAEAMPDMSLQTYAMNCLRSTGHHSAASYNNSCLQKQKPLQIAQADLATSSTVHNIISDNQIQAYTNLTLTCTTDFHSVLGYMHSLVINCVEVEELQRAWHWPAARCFILQHHRDIHQYQNTNNILWTVLTDCTDGNSDTTTADACMMAASFWANILANNRAH